MYITYTYKKTGLQKTVLAKTSLTINDVLSDIFYNFKKDEIRKSNYDEIMNKYSSIESACNIDKLRYRYNVDLLQLAPLSFNDIKNSVTYKLIYENVFLSQTFNCASKFIETQQKLFQRINFEIW